MRPLRDFSLVVLAALFGLTACDLLSLEPSYAPSVNSLIIDRENFIGTKINVRGYLYTEFPEESGRSVLYASRDDAIMLNHGAGVLLIPSQKSEEENLLLCRDDFVDVSGNLVRLETLELAIVLTRNVMSTRIRDGTYVESKSDCVAMEHKFGLESR